MPGCGGLTRSTVRGAIEAAPLLTSLTVNDRAVEFQMEPQTPLLWALRDAANLTGTKYGCRSAIAAPAWC